MASSTAAAAASGRGVSRSGRNRHRRAALDQQDAPLLQVTLANALLQTGDASTVAAVRRLRDSSGLDPAVRDYLDMALQSGGAAAPPRTGI